MAKTKSKKVIIKDVEKEVDNKVEDKKETVKKSEGQFIVFTKVNGITSEVKTDDIAKAIMSAKPELPKTTLVIRITKGKVVRDRLLQLQEAKRLYSNDITMEMFIKNLLF